MTADVNTVMVGEVMGQDITSILLNMLPTECGYCDGKGKVKSAIILKHASKSGFTKIR